MPSRQPVIKTAQIKGNLFIYLSASLLMSKVQPFRPEPNTFMTQHETPRWYQSKEQNCSERSKSTFQRCYRLKQLPNFLQIPFMAATDDNFNSFNLLIIETIS